MVRRHKNVRYLMDDEGRLTVPFQLAGKFPQVQPKPDLKRLSAIIKRGAMRKGLERLLQGKESKEKSPQDWILKALEKLLGR